MSDLNNANTTATTEAVVLTRAQKYAARIELLKKRIEADTKALAEVTLESETAEKLAGVGVNSAIKVKLGRAETTREVLARVLGVKEEDSGSRKFKVMYGEGLDTDVVIIQESQIIEVLG